MLKLTQDTMTNAIEAARSIRAHVRVIDAANRTYAVTGSNGDTYTVRFVVKNGHKFGQCNCPASNFNRVCRHIAQAAQVNVMVQSMRQRGH